jgi:hypothetical protein
MKESKYFGDIIESMVAVDGPGKTLAWFSAESKD